jgi:hypothetical protein
MPLPNLFTVVRRQVAPAGTYEVELYEIDLPQGKLTKDGLNVGASSGFGEVDLVRTLVRTPGLRGVGDVVNMGAGSLDNGVCVVELGIDSRIHVDAEEQSTRVQVCAEAVHAAGKGCEIRAGNAVVIVAIAPACVEVDVAITVLGKVCGEESVDLSFNRLLGKLAAKKGPAAPAHVGVLSEIGVFRLGRGGESEQEKKRNQAHGRDNSRFWE